MIPLEFRKLIVKQQLEQRLMLETKCIDIIYNLKTSIENRKLYIMFEDLLMCKTESDHLIPKSVLPVFLDCINKTQHDL